MEKLKFYDVKKHEPFFTSKYEIKTKGNVKIAYTTAPSGVTATRIIGRV